MLTFEQRQLSIACLYSAGVAFTVPLVLSFLPSFDFWQILYTLLIVPIAFLIWAILGCVRRTRKVWLTLLVFCVVTLISLKATNYFFRVHGRWLLLAASSKARLLAEPPPPGGELRHLDWDGWGMFAQDTEVYLVNDPVNASIPMAKTKDGLRANGIPCPFWKAYRLESHWYAVIYFTSTNWDYCPS